MGVNFTKEILAAYQPKDREPDEAIHELYRGKNLAKSYAVYRPHYPQELFEKIISYHDKSETCGRHLAVDACCGTGQSTLPLVTFFDKVIGLDVSEDQIDNMPKDIPNLESFVAKAEEMYMIQSGTVDLVTIGMSLHWTNTEKFFAEVKRVLKPGGTIAVYTWLVDIVDDQTVGEYLNEALSVLEPYLTKNFLTVLQKFDTIEFPFQNLTRFQLEKQFEVTVDQFKGYIQSMHMIPLYYRDHPETDLLGDMGDRLKKILNPEGHVNVDVKFKLTRPVYLILGRNDS